MNAYSSIVLGESKSLNYDGNGNLTADGQNACGYDTENRIAAADNGATGRYSYDALGRRFQKVIGDSTVNDH